MDWFLSVLVVFGAFLLGRKNKWGWIVMIVNTIGWAIYAIWILDPPQWGLVPASVINFVIAVTAAFKWFREDLEE